MVSFCEVYKAVEASVEAVDAVGGLVDAVEAPGVGYCSTYLLFLPVG